MKKIIILSLFVCLLCGCSKLSDMSIDDIISQGTHREIAIYNKYRKGYKYNLPKGLEVVDSTDYNEVISSLNYKYYLYVDVVSYYNKVIETYEINDNCYISMPITFEDEYGYLEVNELKSGKYLIEIMYNYAKIEVIVEKIDIKETIANSISILSSISFNDNILESILNEDLSYYGETEFNIFKTSSSDSEYLRAIDNSVYVEDNIHDSDLISN